MASGENRFDGDKFSEDKVGEKVKKLGLYENCSEFDRLVNEGSEEEVEENKLVNKFNNDEVMLEVTKKNGMIIYTKVQAQSSKTRRDLKLKRSQGRTNNQSQDSCELILDDQPIQEMHIDGASRSQDQESLNSFKETSVDRSRKDPVSIQ
jgi:hypothetical protein